MSKPNHILNFRGSLRKTRQKITYILYDSSLLHTVAVPALEDVHTVEEEKVISLPVMPPPPEVPKEITQMGYTGPKGFKGDKGERGFIGPGGPIGCTGPSGEMGKMGPKGDAGVMGPTGYAGRAGPRGENGPKGDKGDPGRDGPKGDKGDPGRDGPTGTAGDRFSTKTEHELVLVPRKNTTLIFKVEPGLAYISGNSVIVAQVGNDINSELTSFEGTIQFYSQKTGEIVIRDITNIHGNFGDKPCYYYVNLDGVDGPEGPPGPTGPSAISNETRVLSLDSSTGTVTLPPQEQMVTFSVLALPPNSTVSTVDVSQLQTNQLATLAVRTEEGQSAIWGRLQSVHCSYSQDIVLSPESPYLVVQLQNLAGMVFCTATSYMNVGYNVKM